MWPGKNTLICFNETTGPPRVHGTRSLVRPISQATASHLNSMHAVPYSQYLSINSSYQAFQKRETLVTLKFRGGENITH